MPSRRLFFTILVILFCMVAGRTDSVQAGSFYSSKGIGLVTDFISGRSVGMGGVGLSLSDAFTINYLNPAMLARVPLVTLSGTFTHESTDLKNATQNASISETNVQGFQFVVPLKANTAAIALGASPYSTIEFAFSAADSVGENFVEQEIEGDGGINTGFFSVSIRPFGNLYLGATGIFYFGKLRTLHRSVFNSLLAVNSQAEVARNLTAGGIRWGLNYRIKDRWSLGAIMATRVTLNSDKVVTLRQVREFSDFVDRDFEIPLTLGVGFSVTLFKKLLLGFDYLRQNWSDVESGNYINNSHRFGVGAEFFPGGSRLDSYFKKAVYRAGFYYKDLGLEDPIGERVTEFFGSVGMGLPVKWTAARIDIALEAGRRGSISSNPFRESVIRFTATINVGERWFYRGGR